MVFVFIMSMIKTLPLFLRDSTIPLQTASNSGSSSALRIAHAVSFKAQALCRITLPVRKSHKLVYLNTRTCEIKSFSNRSWLYISDTQIQRVNSMLELSLNVMNILHPFYVGAIIECHEYPPSFLCWSYH